MGVAPSSRLMASRTVRPLSRVLSICRMPLQRKRRPGAHAYARVVAHRIQIADS
ncbi:Uncharacterised protein [Bordetella pertussis]|nr:Uncharacterised protein [Bordetella pertussis]